MAPSQAIVLCCGHLLSGLRVTRLGQHWSQRRQSIFPRGIRYRKQSMACRGHKCWSNTLWSPERLGLGPCEQPPWPSGHHLPHWSLVSFALSYTQSSSLTVISVVFPVLAQAFTHNWWGLLICRLFMGLGKKSSRTLLRAPGRLH